VNPSSAPEDTLLGEILLRNRLATREQLAEALELQQITAGLGAKMRLGEILLQKGIIDTCTLDALLKVQERRLSGDRHPLALRRRGLTPKEDLAIGRLAVDNGLITEERLQFALRIQSAVRNVGFERRIGEILVREGILKDQDVEALLQIQRTRAREEDAEQMRLRHAVSQAPLTHADLLFGNVAVEHAFITETQLGEALEVQRMAREMGIELAIGEVLFEQRVLTEENLEQIAHIQNVKKEDFFGISMTRVIFKRIDEHSLGGILRDRGVLDPWQIDECARIQAELGRLGINRPLGQVFLDRGYVSPEILYACLDEQITVRAENEARRKRAETLRHQAKYATAIALPVGLLLAGMWTVLHPTPLPPPVANDAASEPRAWGPRRHALTMPTSSHPRTILDLLATHEVAGEAREAEERVAAAERVERAGWRRIQERARRLLADLDPEDFGVVLVLSETRDGPEFEVFGQAPYPEFVPIETMILYYGTPVSRGVKVARLRGHLFYARTAPPAGRCCTPPGLYTARAEFDSDRTPETREAIRAAGLPSRTTAEFSAFFGTPEADLEYADTLRMVHERQTARLRALEAAFREALNEPTRSADAWGENLELWDRELREIESQWSDYEAAALATPLPEADRRMRAALSQARSVLRLVAGHVGERFGFRLSERLRPDPIEGDARPIPAEVVAWFGAMLDELTRALPQPGLEDPLARHLHQDLDRRLAGLRARRKELEATSDLSPEWLEPWRCEVATLGRPDAGLVDVLTVPRTTYEYSEMERLAALMVEYGKRKAHGAARGQGQDLPEALRPARNASLEADGAACEALLAELESRRQ